VILAALSEALAPEAVFAALTVSSQGCASLRLEGSASSSAVDNIERRAWCQLTGVLVVCWSRCHYHATAASASGFDGDNGGVLSRQHLSCCRSASAVASVRDTRLPVDHRGTVTVTRHHWHLVSAVTPVTSQATGTGTIRLPPCWQRRPECARPGPTSRRLLRSQAHRTVTVPDWFKLPHPLASARRTRRPQYLQRPVIVTHWPGQEQSLSPSRS
jgi:hypothetical protein